VSAALEQATRDFLIALADELGAPLGALDTVTVQPASYPGLDGGALVTGRWLDSRADPMRRTATAQVQVGSLVASRERS